MTTALTFNLADLFESVADTVPERTAIVSEQRRLSFRELDDRATRLANCWRELGISAGDHIGLQLYNGSEFLEGMLAAYKLSAVAINVNYNYVEAELNYLYQDAKLSAVVTHQAFAPRVSRVVDEIEALQHVFCVADDSGADIDPAFLDYEASLAASSDLRQFLPRDSDDMYIVYRTRDRKVMKSINYFRPDLTKFFTDAELSKFN